MIDNNPNSTIPFLRVVNLTNGQFNDFKLSIGLVNIGKGYLNDISIDNDPSISQIHSSLYFDGSIFSFFDLNNLNKTYLKRKADEDSLEMETNKPYQIMNGSKIILSQISELILYSVNK